MRVKRVGLRVENSGVRVQFYGYVVPRRLRFGGSVSQSECRYRATSLIRNSAPQWPYSRTISRALRWL